MFARRFLVRIEFDGEAEKGDESDEGEVEDVVGGIGVFGVRRWGIVMVHGNCGRIAVFRDPVLSDDVGSVQGRAL